ncbi:MAG: hypothetical protein UT34_C0001G0275 [candidate division WS6 bacterium GW2011_GWF2_39_15]|uniref:Permease n=1 Tax=candidate division WS6 bacterium GW2011_GWF2_39_15 TaxID=1619100 RepID=A0A0G0Q737_9BACT|nr:MAG: hypothetical protein UT34_C0001G0275 [candidate division WS6 bacterium GW2011_GWF2_39_15]
MGREFSAKYTGRGMNVSEVEHNANKEALHGSLFKKSISVDISLKTMVMVLLIVAGLYFGTKLMDVVALLFFAFIISSASLPFVRWLHMRGLSKGLSIAIVYFIGLVVLALLVTLVFVPLISETQKLLSDIPGFVTKVENTLRRFNAFGVEINKEVVANMSSEIVNWISKNINAQSGVEGVKTALATLVDIAGGFVSIITSFLMSIYIIYDHDNFVDLILLRIFDEKKRKRVRQLVLDVEEKLGGWLLGQATLSFIIGGMSWILLTILQVPFALPLAVLAGLLESIPNLGPTLSAIPAVILAFLATSPVNGLFVALGYGVIQQLENTIIVPKVMSNAVGLKPILVIIAVASGFTLAGPIGALLSVPVAVLLQIGYEFYLDLQKLEAEGIV